MPPLHAPSSAAVAPRIRRWRMVLNALPAPNVLPTLPALLLVAGGLAACSDGGAGTSPTGGAATGTTQASPQPSTQPSTQPRATGPAATGTAATGAFTTGAATPGGREAGGVPASGAAVDAKAFEAAIRIPGTIVVDVRTRAEFEGGHLEGARHIDVSGGFRAGIDGLDRSAPYALYCRSGNRSAQAMAVMRGAAFERVYHLADGIGAWQAAGLPVVTG